MSPRTWIRDLRTAISVNPAIYVPLARLTKGDFVVSKDTDVVIEGFPRSGNSYAEAAFRLAQQSHVTIAHHCHAAAQIIYAAMHEIPCIVLIRDPIESCRSLHMLEENVFSIRRTLREYYVFHEAIERYRSKYVLAKFSTATQEFPSVIRAVNSKFDLVFSDQVPDTAQVFGEVNRLSFARGATGPDGEPYSPSRGEKFLEQRGRDIDVVSKLIGSEDLREDRERAEQVFRRLDAGADL